MTLKGAVTQTYKSFENPLAANVLTHFMSLVSFDFPWKLRKQTSDFLCFQGVSKEQAAWNGSSNAKNRYLFHKKNSMLDTWQGVKCTYDDNLRSDYKTYNIVFIKPHSGYVKMRPISYNSCVTWILMSNFRTCFFSLFTLLFKSFILRGKRALTIKQILIFLEASK